MVSGTVSDFNMCTVAQSELCRRSEGPPRLNREGKLGLTEALRSTRGFRFSLAQFRGVAEAALYCAHRTSTVSSCAFCEQEGHLAAPLPILRRPRVARAQKIIRLHPLRVLRARRAHGRSSPYPSETAPSANSEADQASLKSLNWKREQCWKAFSTACFCRLVRVEILINPRRHFSPFGDGPDNQRGDKLIASHSSFSISLLGFNAPLA